MRLLSLLCIFLFSIYQVPAYLLPKLRLIRNCEICMTHQRLCRHQQSVQTTAIILCDKFFFHCKMVLCYLRNFEPNLFINLRFLDFIVTNKNQRTHQKTQRIPLNIFEILVAQHLVRLLQENFFIKVLIFSFFYLHERITYHQKLF